MMGCEGGASGREERTQWGWGKGGVSSSSPPFYLEVEAADCVWRESVESCNWDSGEGGELKRLHLLEQLLRRQRVFAGLVINTCCCVAQHEKSVD